MFGEVGGLNDFLALILSTFLGFLSERHLLVSLAQKLYHGVPQVERKIDVASMTTKHDITFNPLSFKASFIVAQSCLMNFCYRDKSLHRKAMFDGMSKVKDSLDVVKLVRSFRALNTLLRLLLSQDERRLLRLQRRQSVLELN